MSISKKMLLVLILTIVGTFVFANGVEEASVQNNTEAVNLTVWYALSGSSGEAFLEQVDAFLSDPANQDISIETSYSGGYFDTATKISGALMSKTEPNALIGGMPAYTGGRGNFYAGDKVISDPEFDFDDVYSGLWDYATYDEKICNIPYGISTPLMYYNKNILEKAGIDLSNPPKTWDEFAEVATEAQENGNINNSEEFWGFVVKDYSWLFKTQLSQTGNAVFEYANENYDVKPVFDDDNAVQVAQWWSDMYTSKIMSDEHSTAENVFLAGNSAFFVGSSTKIMEWSKTMGDKLGAIPMPYFVKPSVSLGGNTISIFPKNEDAIDDATWRFVKFITSTEPNAEFALGSGYMPIRKSAMDLEIVQQAFDEMPMYKIGFDQLQYGWSYINTASYSALETALKSVVENMSKGTVSPKQAMVDAVKLYSKEADV